MTLKSPDESLFLAAFSGGLHNKVGSCRIAGHDTAADQGFGFRA